MSIKIKYKDITKKMNISSLQTYEELFNKVKKSFKTSDNIKLCYKDADGDVIAIDDDESFVGYKEESNSPAIYIKGPDEDLDISMQSKSNILFDILPKNIDDSVLDRNLSNTSKKDNDLSFDGLLKKQFSEVQVSKQVDLKAVKQPPINAFEKKEIKVVTTVHKGIYCKHCNLEIIGIRWKCLNEFDQDVCNKCFEEKKHPAEHACQRIETEDYLSRLNYHDSIYRLFNPGYEPSVMKSQEVKEWIKEEDILQSKPEAVKVIWKASQRLAEKVVNQYAQWEKQWQSKNPVSHV